MPRASPPTQRTKPYTRPGHRSPSRGSPDDGIVAASTSKTAAAFGGDYEMTDAESERVKIEVDSDGSEFGLKKSKSKGKPKPKAKTVRDTKTAGAAPAPRGRPTKKPTAWTGDEDWAMFQLVHPKAKVDWAAVALAVGNGRDAKSCSNRYYAWSRKLEAAIKTMGV